METWNIAIKKAMKENLPFFFNVWKLKITDQVFVGNTFANLPKVKKDAYNYFNWELKNVILHYIFWIFVCYINNLIKSLPSLSRILLACRIMSMCKDTCWYLQNKNSNKEKIFAVCNIFPITYMNPVLVINCYLVVFPKRFKQLNSLSSMGTACIRCEKYFLCKFSYLFHELASPS